MLIQQLYNAFFGSRDSGSERESIVASLDTPKSDTPLVDKQPVKATGGKFDDDVAALEAKFGSFTTGLCIKMSLTEILTICPRQRARIDAYQGLIKHLAKMGVTLTLTSRKTHD